MRMKHEELSSLISSFERVGLSCNKLRLIEKLYKIASADTSKETIVFDKLLQIVLYFDGKDLTASAPKHLSLPAYSAETSSEYIVFPEYPLSGHTKKMVLGLGLPDYLKNFTSYYMKSRLNQFYGSDLRTYRQAMTILEDLAQDMKRTYSHILSPAEYKTKETKDRDISRYNVQSELKKIATVFREMDQFETQIKARYIPLLAHKLGGEYEEGKFKKTHQTELDELLDLSENEVEDAEEVEEVEDLELPDNPPASKNIEEDILKRLKTKKASLELSPIYQEQLEKLSSLDDGFEKIRDELDGRYAQKLNMSIEEFRKKLNIERLLQFERIKLASKTELQERYLQEVARRQFQDKAFLADRAREVASDIMNGKMGYTKSITKGHKRFELYSPELVLHAWDYLKGKLSIQYEVFLKSLVGTYQTRQKLKDLSGEETQKSMSEMQARYSEELQAMDSKAVQTISEVIKLLRR